MDIALAARQRVLDVASSGTPCRQTAVVYGELEVRDRARDSAFAATLAGVVFAGEITLAPGALYELGGRVETDCFGTVELSTAAPFAVDALCPPAGAISVAPESGAPALATFSGGGVEIDYDSDGAVDAALTSCTADLLRCGS